MKLSLRVFWLVLLGLVAYIVFLLISLPAAQAWSWIGSHVPAQAFGLSGTVWHGQAAVVIQQGRRLEAVQWDLKPASLLLGRLRANVQARLPNGRLRGDFAVTPGGRFAAQQLRLDMPAPELLQWAGLSSKLPVRVEGQLDTLMRDLAVNGPRVERADGLISWHGAAIRFGSAPLPLGDLALRLEPGTGGTNGTLTNQGGAIDLGGTLRLSPDGRFVLDLAVQARDNPAQETVPAMKLLGIPTDGGKVQARLSGNLDGSGLKLEPIGR